MVTGLFGAALAYLLSLLAAWTLLSLRRRACQPRDAGARWSAVTAGALAGCGWSLAPISVSLGRTLMSDEPTALIASLAIVSTVLAFFFGARLLAYLAALMGGLSFGLTAAMRPVTAAILLPVLGLQLFGATRIKGILPTLRRLGPWLAGAVVVPAVVALVLSRSGLSPWRWSAYSLWIPQRFVDHKAFEFKYAVFGNPDFKVGIEEPAMPHLKVGVWALTGLPGLRAYQYLGYVWPILGWLAAAWLIKIMLEKSEPARRIGLWIACSLAVLVVVHLCVFSLYFYPAGRFYLLPMAVCLLSLSVAAGLVVDLPFRPGVVKGIPSLLTFLFFVLDFIAFRNLPMRQWPTTDVRSQVNAWLALPDERRARRVMPFDPVLAQAQGLLGPQVVSGIHEWGKLPNSQHVMRLRASGVLPRQKN
jgi:hypothetical protein